MCGGACTHPPRLNADHHILPDSRWHTVRSFFQVVFLYFFSILTRTGRVARGAKLEELLHIYAVEVRRTRHEPIITHTCSPHALMTTAHQTCGAAPGDS